MFVALLSLFFLLLGTASVFCIAPNTHCSWMVSRGGDRQEHIFGFLVILLVASYIEISCGIGTT